MLFILFVFDLMSERVFSCIADQTGVEQLSSLQHLDLAYNLLLEHSQLAPLSLLHCLNTVRKHMHKLKSKGSSLSFSGHILGL